MRIATVEALPLEASFARHYGGLEKVPPHIARPASHFQQIPRDGQFATVVVVRSDDGLVGYGEAFGLPHPAAATALIRHVVAPVLVGASLDAPGEMLAVLWRYLRALGQGRGIAAEAMSGVDIALWDLAAKAAGQALCGLLGGAPVAIALYASPVTFMASPAETACAASALAAEGFAGVKLKIGRGVDIDLAHVAAARKALGPAVELMLDVNCAYDVETAVDLARRVEPYGVAWLEEPIPPGDAAAMAEIRGRSPVPLAAGENVFELADFEELARAGAVDVLQPNITRAGGVSGMVAINALCRDHGIALAPHGVGGGIGIAAALHAATVCDALTRYEANRLPNALRDALPSRPPVLSDGSFLPPPGPGHGGDPDPALLDSYVWRHT